MRHRKAGRALGRNMSHRKATMKSLALALFTHNAIETTVAKSKELRMYAEPLITLARTDTWPTVAFAELRDNTVVKKLFTEIAGRRAPRRLHAHPKWITASATARRCLRLSPSANTRPKTRPIF